MEVTLETESRKIDGVPHSALRFEYGNPNAFLEISFHRTVRVPDNVFAETLPADMVTNVGCCLPIYQREAMWMYFEASQPFAVMVCVGGINAVSGEPVKDNIGTIIRQKTKLAQGKSIQDYVVDGLQTWLDGIATHDGSVRQFIATPVGSGYSVEAQLTGSESITGLQLEVVPLKNYDHSQIKIKVVNTTANTFIYFILKPSVPLIKVMKSYCETEQKPFGTVRFFWRDNRIQNDDSCNSLGIVSGDVIDANFKLVRGGPVIRGGRSYLKDRTPATIMNIAAGGLIKQSITADTFLAEDWDTENSMITNVQLINSTVLMNLTDIKPPPTPITAAKFAKTRFPYFTTYEELTSIKGKFKDLMSVGELDRENRLQVALHKQEVKILTREIAVCNELQTFLPLSRRVERLNKIRVATNL